MSVYLDTSVVVAALANEPATDAAQRFLAGQSPEDLLISAWTVTEVSSALALKLRTGQVTPPARAAMLSAFHRLIAESLTLLTVNSSHFLSAASYVDQYTLGLRAGDALHLAVASDHGATVATLDRKFAAAGAALGLPVQMAAS